MMLRWFALALLLPAALPLSVAADAAPLLVAPRVNVVDGDTLILAGQRVRLWGIDAPEARQRCPVRSLSRRPSREASRDGAARLRSVPCGAASARALRRLVAAGPVACEPRGVDRYRRVIARCRAGGVDLSAAMVRQGHAIAYRRYSRDYVADEAAARSARAGAWHDTFTDPAIYRQGHRR